MRYGQYDLTVRLAVGGMAEVFLARKAGTAGAQKMVALKRMLPHLSASPEFVQMFLDEARIAALFNHPHIAHVYEYGAESGLHYLTMEYVAGETLREVIQRAASRDMPVPHEGAATILIAACQALHAVHEVRTHDGRPLGVVHRDVTPSNIMIQYDGTVKIVDFGVAQAELPQGRSKRGLRKGKLAYMSPRQAEGKDVDRRADIWSLGVCAWELVTGRRLFYRTSEEAIVRAVREDPIPRPDAVRPDLPREFADIIMNALNRDRQNRQESCEAMQLQVEEYLQSHGTQSSKAMLSRYLKSLFGMDHIRRRERMAVSGIARMDERTAPVRLIPVTSRA